MMLVRRRESHSARLLVTLAGPPPAALVAAGAHTIAPWRYHRPILGEAFTQPPEGSASRGANAPRTHTGPSLTLI